MLVPIYHRKNRRGIGFPTNDSIHDDSNKPMHLNISVVVFNISFLQNIAGKNLLIQPNRYSADSQSFPAMLRSGGNKKKIKKQELRIMEKNRVHESQFWNPGIIIIIMEKCNALLSA